MTTTPTSDEIRASVSKSYATRVTKILEVGEPLTMLGEAGDACCGDSCCTPGAAVADAALRGELQRLAVHSPGV